MPAMGTVNSIFGVEQDSALYALGEGGGWSRWVLPLCPLLCPFHLPPLLQHAHTGSSRSVLAVVGLCQAMPSVPAPAQRGGRGGLQRSPDPMGGFMPQFPRPTISVCLLQSRGAGKVRAEPAAPAAYPTHVVWVGQCSHPEPPLHSQPQLHHGYKRNSSPLCTAQATGKHSSRFDFGHSHALPTTSSAAPCWQWVQ